MCEGAKLAFLEGTKATERARRKTTHTLDPLPQHKLIFFRFPLSTLLAPIRLDHILESVELGQRTLLRRRIAHKVRPPPHMGAHAPRDAHAALLARAQRLEDGDFARLQDS